MLGNAFVDEGTNGAVIQLVLGLRFELCVGELNGNDCRNPFTDVFPRELIAVF